MPILYLNELNFAQAAQLSMATFDLGWLKRLKQDKNISLKNQYIMEHYSSLWEYERPNIYSLLLLMLKFSSFSVLQQPCCFSYQVPHLN